MEGERKCYVCKIVKPLTEFWADKAEALGKSYRCKVCENKRYNEVLGPRIRQTAKYKKRHQEDTAKWRKKNLEKTKAYALSQRVPTGKECERCGGTGRLHRHHPDYSKPLEIITLCVPCHEAEHHGVKV